MDSIFYLFGNIFGYIGYFVLLLPIITSIWARKKKIIFSLDMRLFELLIYLTVIGQIIALVLADVFGLHNVIIFRLFLPIHTAILSYLLLKWSGMFKNNITIILGLMIISISLDLIWGDPNFTPNLMFWFDAAILFVLSFYLTFLRDKNKVTLKHEYNYIHIGVYVYSSLTIIGIAAPNLEIIMFGYFIQIIASIACTFYYAWSFRCLYR